MPFIIRQRQNVEPNNEINLFALLTYLTHQSVVCYGTQSRSSIDAVVLYLLKSLIGQVTLPPYRSKRRGIFIC